MIRPFGEAAFLVDVADAAAAQGLRRSLLEVEITGVTGLVPGRASLLVEFDPVAIEADDLFHALDDGPAVRAPRATGRVRRIPVVYGGEWGPDLADVAAFAGLSEAAVIERHASTELDVLFGGFAPGFAYLGDVPAALSIPRLATPRTRVTAGSVGLADGMSGVYPAELPGGWRIIGRTPIALFDPRRDPPAYLVPGDRVRFDPIPAEAWGKHVGAAADW